MFGFIGDVARKFVNWIDLDFWEIVLLFMMFMLYRLIAKAHTATGNDLDIQWLLVDEKTGRVSLKKFGALIAIVFSTWIVLFMTVKGQMTEAVLGLWLFALLGVYITPQTVTAWRQPPAPPAPPASGSPG